MICYYSDNYVSEIVESEMTEAAEQKDAQKLPQNSLHLLLS